jgi:pimeloyl-ACP methyl ester carboxylesterase
MQTKHRNSSEVVVILHGFGASPGWMTPVCRRVTRTGRRVVNWGYPSWRRSIDLSGKDLLKTVYDIAGDESVQRIHFLAYSMGSIICRAALLKDPQLPKLGRVVMLGPPNRGSHVASLLAPLFGWIVPAARELSTSPDSYVNSLPRMQGVEVGVIAGGLDRIVRHDRTHLPSQREHLVVPLGHAGLLLSQEVTGAALRFVETGSFELPKKVPETKAVVLSSWQVPSAGTGMPLENR